MSDTIILHMPTADEPDYYKGFETLNQTIDNNKDKKIVVICTEMFYEIQQSMFNYDWENVEYNLPSVLNYKLKRATVKPYMYWFENTRDFYKRNTHIIDKLLPYKHKEYSFEALLGTTNQREHRVFLLQLFKKYNLYNVGIIKAFDEVDIDKVIADHIKDGNYAYEPETYHNALGIKVAIQPAKFYGDHVRLCQILPISVYNQTAYSVVSESWPTNSYSFFTEKTAKPLIGKRIFLIFAGQYFLKNLRSLGFKTFDGIIDESFDNIENDNERWTKQFNQLLYLINQNQETILDAAKPILEHNHQLIMNYDFGRLVPDWSLTA